MRHVQAPFLDTVFQRYYTRQALPVLTARNRMYLFWKRKPLAGLVVLLVPPIIASILNIRRVDLESYKQSAFGRSLHDYMTPLMVAMRLLGTVIPKPPRNPSQSHV